MSGATWKVSAKDRERANELCKKVGISQTELFHELLAQVKDVRVEGAPVSESAEKPKRVLRISQDQWETILRPLVARLDPIARLAEKLPELVRLLEEKGYLPDSEKGITKPL